MLLTALGGLNKLITLRLRTYRFYTKVKQAVDGWRISSLHFQVTIALDHERSDFDL